MADYRYDYQSGMSYPTHLPYDNSEGSFVPSDLPPRNQIYSTSLMNLTRTTTANLEILKSKLIAADPCYTYGPQQWHPNRKWEEYEEFSNNVLENSRSKYDQHGVHFTTQRNINALCHVNGHQPKPVKRAEDEDIEHTGPVNLFCYLCTTVDEHQQHIARRGLQLKAKEKVHPRIKFIPPPPCVKVKPKEEEEAMEVLYKVSVMTGMQPLAATSAKVSMILRGRDGTMKKRNLTKKSSVNFTFGRGTTENFFIKGPKIGQLRSMTLMHDGLEKKHSWFVEQVTITVVSSGQVFVFPCKQWLSLYLGDMQLKRTLQAHVQDMVDTRTEYDATITTADKFGAGTDANVFLTIYGKKGVSSKFPLRNRSKNNFEAGQDDKFKVTVDRDIGTLTKIRLEHDNSGLGPGWFVEKVVLMDTESGQSWTFPCGQWLATDEGDGKTCKDLMPMKMQQTLGKARKGKKGRTGDTGPMLWYEFAVTTGTRRHAGTDAHIFVTLLGALGRSGDVALDDGRDRFEKGQTDVLRRKALDVGDMKRVIVRHDNAGLAAGWFLERMSIKRYFSAQEVKDRLSTMASELHEHVSNITGEEAPNTPTKQRRASTLKHQRSVSFESLKDAERKKEKRKEKHRWEEEEYEEDVRGRRKKDEKKGKKDTRKHRWDDEEEEERTKRKDRSSSRRGTKNLVKIPEEEDERRERRHDKRKKTYKYQGIEVEATDSDDDSDSEYLSKRGQQKHGNHAKTGNARRKAKHCYADSDSDSDDRKSKESKTKKKYDSDSDSDRKKKSKRRVKKPASSSESSSSETDEEVYTKWTKGRVPYCDEYVFECNRWLATDEDDGLIQRELRPVSVTTYYKIDD